MGGDQLFADSTLMEANASVQSLVARDPDAGPGQSPKAYVKRVFWENPVEEGSVPTPVGSSDSRPGSVAQEIRDRKEPWRKKKSTAEGKPRRQKKRNQEQVSTTDPDASVVKQPSMKTKLAYKSHFTVDGHQRVITVVEVTPAAVEDSSPVVRLLDRQPTRPQFFCADLNYGVPVIYEELRRRDIRPVIPRHSFWLTSRCSTHRHSPMLSKHRRERYWLLVRKSSPLSRAKGGKAPGRE